MLTVDQYECWGCHQTKYAYAIIHIETDGPVVRRSYFYFCVECVPRLQVILPQIHALIAEEQNTAVQNKEAVHGQS